MAKTHTFEMCLECPGRCCSKQRLGLGYLALTPKEAERKLFKPHIQWISESGTKEKRAVLSLDPKCHFLGDDNRCTIYDRRPATCRSYVCWGHPEIMADVLLNRPTHRAFLKKHQCLPGQAFGLPLDEEKLVTPI